MDRKKVIGIFSGFLAVMLLFTILSRAVTGASMARVETVKIKTGTIDHKVTGSGRVEAGKEIAVYTESGQRVKEIFVREGQSVEAGEVLFTVDLEDAQSARNVEQQNRERAKTRASEDYNQAVADGDASVAQAKAAWDQAEQALQNFLAEGPPEVNDGQSRAKQENDADEASGVRKDEEEEEKGPSGQSEQETGNDQNAADKLAAWEAEKARLEQAAAEAKGAYDSAVSSRTENVKTAARALEDANAPAASDTTSRQNEITSQQQELVLGKLQDLKHAEGRVTAPVQGVVTNISILTGDFTTEGTAMRLSDTSQGSRLTALVDKSNEKYVSKGSQVNISVPGSQEKITDYTVTSVTENEEDPTLLELVIDMPDGRLETGTRAEIEIVQRSENYSAVIPLQALHEEQNGYFVLVMEEEQGVMGKELVAKRYEVKVQDKNSTNAALEEGLLTSEQEIISSSSRSIGDGSRVRKMEGNSGL